MEYSSISESLLEQIKEESCSDELNEAIAADYGCGQLVQTRKKRGKSKKYTKLATYDSIETALKTINDSTIDGIKWVRKNRKNTHEGEKIFFRCEANCPKVLYILLHAENNKPSILISNDMHQHKKANGKTILPKPTREKVVELMSLGITKPLAILDTLKECDVPQITTTQLNNLKNRLIAKSELTGHIKMNESFLKENVN